MSTASVIKGSCLCQRVQYEVTGPPKMRLLCHCDNCRKVTGSTFMANALYRKDQLRIISGEDVLKVYEDSNTESGNTTSRKFCSNCSSPLFTSRDSDPSAAEVVAITSGTMDLGPSRENWAPQAEVYCKNRREWIVPVEGTVRSEVMEAFAPSKVE
ncbi:uncharacterized protein N7498_010087 [Penicillium cinerascens]|uniref:CENP-V/GFA domain-containing protein n=1 Tax=Penicillium cinerascens TaxID=70096 RepID=A0A9W9J730_9EURO|nr:uncharacterized protein N7498_010087 [Penicillium cinerascens]KAJ5191102.1 hypothetical protein N7498_010087 [Penicillium cinerascens]